MGPENQKGRSKAPLEFTSVPAGSVEEGTESPAAARMSQFAQRLGFNLADAFASDREVLANLFQCVFSPVFKAESHLDYAFLTWGERIQDLFGHFLQVDIDHCI